MNAGLDDAIVFFSPRNLPYKYVSSQYSAALDCDDELTLTRVDGWWKQLNAHLGLVVTHWKDITRLQISVFPLKKQG